MLHSYKERLPNIQINLITYQFATLLLPINCVSLYATNVANAFPVISIQKVAHGLKTLVAPNPQDIQ